MASRIKLMSSDGEVFDVENQVACQSKVIETLLGDLGDSDDDDEPVPLYAVNGATLRKVIAWCTQHQNDSAVPENESAAEKEKRTDNNDAWDMDYLKMEPDILMGLIKAADYLEITGLLDAACKTAANMIKGKTTVDIQKTFNIVHDFSPEDAEEIRKENLWLVKISLARPSLALLPELTTEDLREMFNTTNDVTAEEEEQARAELQ